MKRKRFIIHQGTKQKQKSLSLRNSLHHDCDEGLTLVELLIVLALTVVVIGMVYSFFYFVNQSFSRGGDQYQLQSGISLAADFITSEVRNATEIEIVALPLTVDSAYEYIYIEDQKLKHHHAGTGSPEDKTEKILTDESKFTLQKDASGRCYLLIKLNGSKGDDVFSLSTEVLLNNIADITGTSSGTAICYKKYEEISD